MLQQSTIQFLNKLNRNNNKPWFDAHRDEYDAARENFMGFVGEIIQGISKFDPPIAKLAPKDCMFRINRDVRFSKDKRPYKNNMAAYFNEEGKKASGAGYYFHLEPGKSFAAAGIWMPEPAVLAAIRQEIDYNLPDFNNMLKKPGFKKNFPAGIDQSEKLVRPPKGYDEENPAIEWLKLKSFIVMHPFTDSELVSKKAAADIAQVFREARPLVAFINTARS